MPEWLKGADCKSAALCYVGSNPTRPTFYKIFYLKITYTKVYIYMMRTINIKNLT